MCYMQYVMRYMQDGMCCFKYDKYDDACYSHSKTFLIQIRKVPHFPNTNMESLLTLLIPILQFH